MFAVCRSCNHRPMRCWNGCPVITSWHTNTRPDGQTGRQTYDRTQKHARSSVFFKTGPPTIPLPCTVPDSYSPWPSANNHRSAPGVLCCRTWRRQILSCCCCCGCCVSAVDISDASAADEARVFVFLHIGASLAAAELISSAELSDRRLAGPSHPVTPRLHAARHDEVVLGRRVRRMMCAAFDNIPDYTYV